MPVPDNLLKVISDCLAETTETNVVELSRFQQCLRAKGVPGMGPDPAEARLTCKEVAGRLGMVVYAIEGDVAALTDEEAEAVSDSLLSAMAKLDSAVQALAPVP